MCWYRMLPEIELTREVEGKQADLLQTCFSPGVIDIVTTANGGLLVILLNITVIVLNRLWIYITKHHLPDFAEFSLYEYLC